MNNNNVGYDRVLYLEIFERLHHRDDIPPYPLWQQDNNYYHDYMDVFMNDMRDLANMDRQEFSRILARVQSRIRGPSELKNRMVELNRSLAPVIKTTGGGRRSRNRSRNSRKQRKSRTQRK